MKLSALFTLLGVLAVQSATATTWYVATTGKDSGSGSSSAPFATIQRAVTAWASGDTVIVMPGTYGYTGRADTCYPSCTPMAGAVILTSGGSSSVHNVIKAQTPGSVILDCQMACDAYFDFERGADYIDLQGFTITNALWTGINVNSVTSYGTFSQLRISRIGNTANNSALGVTGIFFGTSVRNYIVDRSEIDHVGRTSGPAAIVHNHDHGLYIYGANITIQNTILHDNIAGWDIQVAPGASNLTIVNNTFGVGQNPARSGQIELWSETPACHTNLIIANNIFYMPSGHALDQFQECSGSSITAINNLVYGPGNPSLVDPAQGSISSWRISGTVTSNPMLSNPAGDDYRLTDTSAAIGMGASATSVSYDFSGKVRPGTGKTHWDIGAYQY